MAEDWQDCPALGPGWKRREAFRKSGASCGRSDIYYQSPTGEKIRSKVELTRYLGPACDLTLFNFRQGILCYPVPKTHPLPAPNKKKKKPSKPAKAKKRQVGPQKSEVRKETPRKGRKAGAGAAAGSGAAAGAAPASLPALGCCENCGIRLSRDCIKRQRLKALCKDCRAQRIAFNREQRMFRRVGCGECTACLVKEDCGACSICRLQLPHDVASELFCKCERRRCLRIVEKSRGCGVCRGCQTQEDCGRCRVCLRPARPGLKRQWRCLQRRCFWHFAHRFRGHPQGCHQCPPQVVVSPTDKRDRRKSGSKVAARRHSRAQPLPPRPASQHPEPTELHISDLAPTSPAEFIYYCVDEDELKRLLPSTGPGSEEGAGLPPCRPCRKRPGSPRRRLRLSSPSKAPLAVLTTPPGPARASAKQQAGRGFVLPPPDTDFVFLQEGAASPVQVPGPAAASSEAPLQEAQSWGVAMPQVKQEKTDAPEEWTSGTGFPTSALQPGYPSKALDSDLPPVKQEPPGPAEDREENREDYVSESAPEEEAGGVGTPVITEIFSLGGTRLRDAAAWLPRLHKLLAVNENEYFTELQLKEEIL
ncbi:methyl-CpG-binding domain protein 1 isoform X14 [Peromyscus maniculatus bairdii]|uniref:methyl-CpG-binding domain protein 1 isoform X14 n=1 Tax=Peromyscus maniculatus bairdii TaxID=230844 RepID=UPI00042ACA5A|nr:methyl-CpG-binding domain protein 1 isoform X11 [Peromyscus maniculatus bairdii]